MTLGEIIKEYRESQNPVLSQRDFAKISGLSNSYISQLEMNRNSKNGEPIKPSLEALRAVADAIRIPLDTLLKRLDDIDVDISGKPAPAPRNLAVSIIARGMESMTEEQQKRMLAMARAAFPDVFGEDDK